MAKKVNLRNYIIGASIGMVYLERGQFRNENVLMADGCSQHFLFLIFGWTKYTAYQIILCWCQIIKLSLYFFPNMCDSRNFGHQTVETVLDFILEGYTITTDGDCSHEINRCLLLGRKIMTSLDCILKHQFFMLNFLYSPTLESPLDCKEIQPVHPKGNQSWMFIGRIDVEVEIPIFRPPDMKSWLIWKDPDVGKDWRQEEKGTTEDEMIRCHHWLSGYEFG